MSDDQKLSLPQRAVLFTLMAEARELTNAELKEIAGVTLDGKPRQRLNGTHPDHPGATRLVTSVKRGRSFVHELTDDGWAWCRRELGAPAPSRAGSAGGALHAVLAGLGRYLERSDQRLSDVFHPDAERQIRRAYETAAREPGAQVRLSTLREHLEGLPRQAVDSALTRMMDAGTARLTAETNQKTLSPDDRAAAVHVGGEDRHLLALAPA